MIKRELLLLIRNSYVVTFFSWWRKYVSTHATCCLGNILKQPPAWNNYVYLAIRGTRFYKRIIINASRIGNPIWLYPKDDVSCDRRSVYYGQPRSTSVSYSDAYLVIILFLGIDEEKLFKKMSCIGSSLYMFLCV